MALSLPLDGIRGLFRRPSPGAYAALDIGTEYAKALIFTVEDGVGTVRGSGRHRQTQTAMQDGLITDIEAVVKHCHAALQQAEEMAGMVGKQAIVGHGRRAGQGDVHHRHHGARAPYRQAGP